MYWRSLSRHTMSVGDRVRRSPKRALMLLALAVILTNGIWHWVKPLPDGLAFEGEARPASEVRVFADRTYLGTDGARVAEQTIFDEMFALIDGAESLIVADQFLFNPFQGPTPETTRALSSELTERLIARKQARPALRIVLVTDPVNTLYGGQPSDQLDALRAAGVEVVMTDLTRLRDSHLPYSPFWRALARPFGNAAGNLLPSPISPGRVSLRSYLALLNFKANHRKTLIADRNGALVGWVSSANPHDGSSAHDNMALRFDGPAVLDLLASENAVIEMSGETPVDVAPWAAAAQVPESSARATVRVLTEGAIRDQIVATLEATGAGDAVDVMVFYLSHRGVARAIRAAHQRGARVRVLLDPAKDAFGREKGGLPNRPTAHGLVADGVAVRWCHTNGEQCHSKTVLVRRGDGSATLISGSANFTRRNLDNLNLESDVRIDAPSEMPAMAQVAELFDDAWTNAEGQGESLDYEAYADARLWRRLLSFTMEHTGMSTF